MGQSRRWLNARLEQLLLPGWHVQTHSCLFLERNTRIMACLGLEMSVAATREFYLTGHTLAEKGPALVALLRFFDSSAQTSFTYHGSDLDPLGFLGGVSSLGPPDNLPRLFLGNNTKAKPKISWLILCRDALVQWFSILPNAATL